MNKYRDGYSSILKTAGLEAKDYALAGGVGLGTAYAGGTAGAVGSALHQARKLSPEQAQLLQNYNEQISQGGSAPVPDSVKANARAVARTTNRSFIGGGLLGAAGTLGLRSRSDEG